MAILVPMAPNSSDVVSSLARLIFIHGIPGYTCSNYGPEFWAGMVCEWLSAFDDGGLPTLAPGY